MMALVYIIVIGIGLGIIIYQDFKMRKISLYVLIILFILLFISLSAKYSFSDLLLRSTYNIFFSLIILVSGTLMVKLRRHGIKFLSVIGVGDFLFLFTISPVFPFQTFLVFLYTSLILIIIIYGIMYYKDKQKEKTIPLAGALAIPILIYITALELFEFDIYQSIEIMVFRNFMSAEVMF